MIGYRSFVTDGQTSNILQLYMKFVYVTFLCHIFHVVVSVMLSTRKTPMTTKHLKIISTKVDITTHIYHISDFLVWRNVQNNLYSKFVEGGKKDFREGERGKCWFFDFVEKNQSFHIFQSYEMFEILREKIRFSDFLRFSIIFRLSHSRTQKKKTKKKDITCA